MRHWRWCATLALTLLIDPGLGIAEPTLHYAPNRNFDARGVWQPGAAGFNLADVSDPEQLRHLPVGVKGLVWVGQCGGADQKFIAGMTPYLRTTTVFGFYLMDDPDPRFGPRQCKPAALRAEADWLHEHFPGTVTLIVLMNLSAANSPSFRGSYNPGNSHIDLYGIDPYPCRSELSGCSGTMIKSFVTAAEAAGIPRARIVPVYQAFGGGSWRTSDGGEYLVPNPAQARAMLAQWQALIPAPRLDFAYSWGLQRGDHALEDSSALRAVFAAHNRSR